jgi:hypothetical protein
MLAGIVRHVDVDGKNGKPNEWNGEEYIGRNEKNSS